MAATLETQNPLGIAYQTGYFSGDPDSPINQTFFDAAFAARINPNPIYKNKYHCNIIQDCGMSQWMDSQMGYDTDCHSAYTILETYGFTNKVKIVTGNTIPSYPGTATIHVDTSSTYVSGQFILPQKGNSLVCPPDGTLVKVTDIDFSSPTDIILTVQQRDTTGNTGSFTIENADELIVLSGSELSDCVCPTGQFRFPDVPIETDLEMGEWGDRGYICGKAIHECTWLKIPFFDECGNEIMDMWYTEALRKMYQDHEQRKFYERLFNPSWGLVPTLRAKAIKWTPAASDKIELTDIEDFKEQLDLNGVGCKEFTWFCGREIYRQWQNFLLSQAVAKLDSSMQPNDGCKWLNLEYCGIRVLGLTFHIYEECSFSNGKLLGGPSYVFPESAIIIPMCNRPVCNRSNGRTEAGRQDQKMLSTVYYKSAKTGKVFDNVTDANGILSPRNSFGAGCEEQEWTIKSKFLQEIHCPNWWGYVNLGVNIIR
jgi:hypothetical protein